jgi:hypothetical protein
MMAMGGVSVRLHAVYVLMSACTTSSMVDPGVESVSNVVIMSRISRPDISISALTTPVEHGA